MKQAISKSSLSKAQSDLVELFQRHPYCRIESLRVRGGEPLFTPPPRVIQKVRIGSDSSPRPESARADFCLKKHVVECLAAISSLGDGEVRSSEVARGLPISLEIERQPAPS